MSARFEITPQMISAGVSALATICPMDIAFPHRPEDEAVEAVLTAALDVQRAVSQGTGVGS